ncbi:MAG TPA: PASTA domain-containing protein [bacterium]|jgi:serine/threonine-protein kinase
MSDKKDKFTPPPGSIGSRRSSRRNKTPARGKNPDKKSFRYVASKVDKSLGPTRKEKVRESQAVQLVMWLSVIICLLMSALLLTYQSWAFFAGDKNEVQVPNVVGIKYEDAALSIENAGLILSIRSEEYSDDLVKNRVIAQIPAPGSRVKLNREVLLDISLGSRTLTTPNVIGFERADAIAALDAMGVNHRVTPQYSDMVSLGTVVNQAPPAGTPIAVGEVVEIITSAGPLNRSIPMPDIEGLPYQDAIAIIEEARLVLRRISRTYQPGTTEITVSSQFPLSGAQVRQGSEVLLTLQCPTNLESLGQREASLKVIVPEKVGTVEVRIIVQDRYETKQVYQAQTTGPTTVSQLITSWGRTTVKVFFDNRIVREETY